MQKKILLFTESLGSGGAERQLVGLAAALKDQGYDVSVMTYIENQFYEPFLHEHNINYILCKSEGNKFIRLFHVARALRKIKPDTVISFLTSSNMMMCLLKPLGFRLVVSSRNTTISWGGYNRFIFWLYRFADVIVANSSFECDNIKKHKPALQNKTISITNFVDTDLFLPMKQKSNIVPIILCVGRVTEQKNVIGFINAVKKLNEKGILFQIKWFGDQSNVEYFSQVITQTKELQLEDIVHFHKPSTNILKEYQSADIFCLPSVREGYPNVICEAMSCELPIACSNVCENPKIVEDGVNGFLFNPHNEDEIANILAKLICLTPAQRDNIGKKNRNKMIKGNSIDAFCKKYIEII